MTHEHLDHVKGLLASNRAGVDLAARYAWLTASADPTYYERYPEARSKRRAALRSRAPADRTLLPIPSRGSTG